MDLRLIDDRDSPRQSVHWNVWRRLVEKCFRAATLTTIGGGAWEIRRLIIAHQCLAV